MILIEHELTEIKKKIARAKINIIQLKEIIDRAENTLKSYYTIANDLIEKYKRFNKDLKNYHVIYNINSLKNSNAKIMKDLDIILSCDKSKNDYLNQCETLFNIYINEKENYLYGHSVENGNLIYMNHQKNFNNIDDNNANNNVNNKEKIIEKVLQKEEDDIKINKKGHNIDNKNMK